MKPGADSPRRTRIYSSVDFASRWHWTSIIASYGTPIAPKPTVFPLSKGPGSAPSSPATGTTNGDSVTECRKNPTGKARPTRVSRRDNTRHRSGHGRRLVDPQRAQHTRNQRFSLLRSHQRGRLVRRKRRNGTARHRDKNTHNHGELTSRPLQPQDSGLVEKTRAMVQLHQHRRTLPQPLPDDTRRTNIAPRSLRLQPSLGGRADDPRPNHRPRP